MHVRDLSRPDMKLLLLLCLTILFDGKHGDLQEQL